MTAALLLLFASLVSAGESPRVVLETTAGDLVLALRPDAAPKQCARFLELVELGVYDSVPLERVDPTLYLRLAPAARRREPLSRAQRRKLSEPRPAVEGGLEHGYGVVTVAHARGEDEPTGTALAIMTARVPSMDGRFSAFATVARGQDVLERLRSVPCRPDHSPLERVEIVRAYALDAGKAASLPLRGPPAPRRLDWRPGAAVAALALCVLPFLRGRGARSACLLALLAGFFVAFAGLAGAARASSWLGTAGLLASIGVFSLMSSFERPSTKIG